MKRLLLIAAICVVAAPALASDTFPITGVQGALHHNAATGEITKVDGVNRALGRPLWRMIDEYVFTSMAENELHLDCADLENNVGVQSIGFAQYTNSAAALGDNQLFIPLYVEENNGDTQTRQFVGGFYMANIPGSTHPANEYWGYHWTSTLINDPILFNGSDLDADGLQDFGYGFWFLETKSGIMGPSNGGEPNVINPTGPGAEDGWDLFLDPNFQFDPNLLGTAPATTTYSGYYDFTNPIYLGQFYFEMYAPACQNQGDSGRYCSADIFGYDCLVNLNDLAQLLGNYGMTTGASVSDGDVDPFDEFFPGDGDVDLGDLAELLGQYGDDCNE